MGEGEAGVDEGGLLVFFHKPSHGIAHRVGQEKQRNHRQQSVAEQAETGQFLREIHDPVFSYQCNDGVDTGEQNQQVRKDSGDQAH